METKAIEFLLLKNYLKLIIPIAIARFTSLLFRRHYYLFRGKHDLIFIESLHLFCSSFHTHSFMLQLRDLLSRYCFTWFCANGYADQVSSSTMN